MANDKLILRTLNSPWLTPTPDFTKGTVLTHVELDNNFIYLRGEVIYSGSVTSGMTILHKINGDVISYDNGQNNLVINREYQIQSGDTVAYIVNNTQPSITLDDKTNCIITIFEGELESTYIFTRGKGNWGFLGGGDEVLDSDFILLKRGVYHDNFSTTIYIDSNQLDNCITCTGTSVEEKIVEYINTKLPPYTKSQNDSDIWIEFTDINA
jgi:hypothetical protein